jgi:hypothetical protein|tara:strand:- start:745 stop:978 length:234 start_codon:yes stop_codon:yes gene_type:complete
MKFLLIGTLCLLTDLSDPTSVVCKYVINEEPYTNSVDCIKQSRLFVDQLKPMLVDNNGSVKFFCYPYQPIKLDGEKI